jgi:hypothetical protein
MKKAIATLLLLFVPAIAMAGETWTENFNGLGTGGDHDGSCAGAKTTAQAASLAACALKQGSRGDQKFSDCACNCQAIGPVQVCSCTVVLSVTCTTGGGAPPPAPAPTPAPGPAPSTPAPAPTK